MSSSNDGNGDNPENPAIVSGGQSPSEQVLQQYLQLNQIHIKESDTNLLVRMEQQLRQTSPQLADRWLEDALEVSKHRRDVEKDMVGVIKQGQRDEFRLEVINSLMSVFALICVLGVVVFCAYIGQPGVSIAVFTAAVALLIVLRLGKKHQQDKAKAEAEPQAASPAPPKKPPRQRNKK